MSTIETFVSDDEAPAVAVVSAIESLLGDDVVLTIGEGRVGPESVADLTPSDDARVVGLRITDRPGAFIALVVTAELGEAIRVKGGASLLASSVPLLAPAISALAATGTTLTASETADEIDVAALMSDAPMVAFPVLRGAERVAVLVLRDGTPGAVAEAAIAAAPHEFQPLGEAAPAPSATDRALELLNDVEMEVTAELGRKRIPVRDLLALTPGAVVELDRAAGSPVDVLVNGTVIARGEVVVIDEEFGIRIVEVLGRDEEHA